MQKAFFFFLLFLNLGVSAQNSKRGYKFLEKGDYDKAYEVFREVLDENSQDAIASFGMALILADENAARFQLINAWEFAMVTNKYLDKITPEELEFVGEYFTNTEVRTNNRPVKKKMSYALETIEAKLIKYIREENNLDIVYAVLEKYPDYKYRENVIHIRNQLEFRKYEKQNTLQAYLEFLQKFPEAAQVDKAIRYRDRLSFEKAKETNTVEGYRDYIKNYPRSEESSQAIKLLYASAFQSATQANTIQAFDNFIETYPDALEISEAREWQKKLLYEYARKIQTLEAYNEFIRKYPEGQQYVDIFNLKSINNGMQFLGSHPIASNNIQWARSFDEEGAVELSALLAIDSMNAYITGGTVFRSDTGSSDAWIIKTSADGKMIWNKYVGEEYNDELNHLAVNARNEIIGVGNTWTGKDSSARESWIFKLGPDGQKLWSRRLGDMHVNCFYTSGHGPLFLGGFQIRDSVERYCVVSLNENGKKLWSRIYTGEGQINGIAGMPEGRIVLAGNHWRAKTDAGGYLLWEASFNAHDSIMQCLALPKGEMLYLGIRNNQKFIAIKTSWDGKNILDKEFTLDEVPVSVSGIIKTMPNQVIAIVGFNSHQSLFWINTSNGEIQQNIRFEPGMKLSRIQRDMLGNLILTAYTGEILLIKNSGTTF